MMPELTWAQLARYRYIEWHLAHAGQINRGDLMAEFCISEIQASNDFTAYQAAAPDNLIYDRKAKTYRPSPDFKRRFPLPKDLLSDLKSLRNEVTCCKTSAGDRSGDSRGLARAELRGMCRAFRAMEQQLNWLIDVRHRPGGPHPLAEKQAPPSLTTC